MKGIVCLVMSRKGWLRFRERLLGLVKRFVEMELCCLILPMLVMMGIRGLMMGVMIIVRWRQDGR